MWGFNQPKKWLAWLLCGHIILSAAGCSAVAPTHEPVTIKFAVPEPASDERFRNVIAEFNKSYPYITIEIVRRADEADVFYESPFALYDLIEDGAIYSLDPFLGEDKSFDISDFYPGVLDLFTYEGKTWAIPAGAEVLVMYYNQDLFDRYGVPYPAVGWTWDDFLNAAMALRDSNAGVYGYAPVQQFLDIVPFIFQHGGRLADDFTNPTRPTFDDPLTIEAVAWYAALMYEHNVAPTNTQMVGEFSNSPQAAVYSNKVGMWSGWFSERGGRSVGGLQDSTWPAEWKMRWGMAPLPRDARPATLAFVGGYFISTRAQSPESCWKWVSFLSQQTPTDGVPVRKSHAESSDYARNVGESAAAVARASMENAVLISPALVQNGAMFQIFGQAIYRVLNGTETAEEALTAAQRQATR